MSQLKFTPEGGEALCDAMVETNTLQDALDATKVCAQIKTLYTWLRLSERGDERFLFEWLGVEDQLNAHWEHAQTLQAQRLSEELETMNRETMAEVSAMSDQKMASNRVQALRSFQDMVKWKTGYLHRQRFGKANDAAGPLLPVQVIINLGGKVQEVSLHQIDAIENNNRSQDQRLIVAPED